MADEAYAWEEGHFDGVIKQYREMLVREGMWEKVVDAGELQLTRMHHLLLMMDRPGSQRTKRAFPTRSKRFTRFFRLITNPRLQHRLRTLPPFHLLPISLCTCSIFRHAAPSTLTSTTSRPSAER